MKTIDLSKMRLMGKEPKMQDPIRFPKIQGKIERDMKDSYAFACNKMIVDITKKIVELKK